MFHFKVSHTHLCSETASLNDLWIQKTLTARRWTLH